MIVELGRKDSYRTGVFGGPCPYFWVSLDQRVHLADTVEELIDFIPKEQRQIDVVGCLELLEFDYLLGSRTLVCGIGRLPWRAVIFGDGTLIRYRAIPHDTQEASPREIAKKLRAALEEEIDGYVAPARRVWVLLSGGLDSRVVAGILKSLQAGWQEDREIRAVSWGHAFARDIVYAQRIAEYLGWPLHVIDYTAGLFWENLEETSSWGGAEISGIHLHGMRRLRSMVAEEDVVIAASWGNSIGRGAFMSKHLAKLTLKHITNPHGLIVPALANAALAESERDRAAAWALEEDTGMTAMLELDQQENYMRRLIGQAMDYIRGFSRLEQAFTDPSLVSLMWSYSPTCRMAEVYYHLIRDLDKTLYDIPNASTGVSPSGLVEPDPLLTKSHHEFGEWCRVDYLEQLRSLVHSPLLSSLGVFNMSAVHALFEHWRQEEVSSLGHTEAVSHLAGIALAAERFGLRPARKPSPFTDGARFRLGRVKGRLVG